MKSKYIELFNNITPPETDDELLRNILSRRSKTDSPGFSTPKKKRTLRRPVIIAAAAVATAGRRCDRRRCFHRVGFYKVVPGVLFPEST